jgi:hypothetical protein
MNKTIVRAGCMDCDLLTEHHTITEAEGSLYSHRFDQPAHRLLVDTPANGWTRYFTGREE